MSWVTGDDVLKHDLLLLPSVAVAWPRFAVLVFGHYSRAEG